jgi:hypothetical protein
MVSPRFDLIRSLRTQIKRGKLLNEQLTKPPVQATGISTSSALSSGQGFARDPLYRAERRLQQSLQDPWLFYATDQAKSYLDAVASRARELYSRATFPFTVQQADEASYQAGRILTPLPVQQMTLLHELAHHLAGPDAKHGPVFLQAYNYLLKMEMGLDPIA